MLELIGTLAAREPDKAERLRDAIDRAGERRVKARLAKLVKMLRSQRLSDADREQEALLADLEALLQLMTSTTNELDRRRAERVRLERFKRSVRQIMDEQLDRLQRTRRAAQRGDDRSRAGQADQRGDEASAALRRIERLQRQTQEKAEQLQRDMQPKDRAAPPTPGQKQVGQSAERMQSAADRLGEGQPDSAQRKQQESIEQLQQALDELDDALRQVRREEIEETLTALEHRFRSLLTREQDVRDVVVALDAKGAEQWKRTDELQLAAAVKTQQQVVQDCQVALRILEGEGSTVILPELVRQLAADMQAVAQRLDRADTSEPTRVLLADIIALLEEIVGAIEAKRNEEPQDEQGQPQEGGQQDRPMSLLPPSAELKLLRSSQVRVNERTGALRGADGNDRILLRHLAERQRRLAELARKMNERN